MAGDLTTVARGTTAAYLRMLAAIGGDLAASIVPGGERDPFLKRDPGYIERTLPALRVSSKLYFRADVRGLTSTMQRTLTRLSNARSLPILG